MISETKLDESFPAGEFYIDGFSTPFRHDRDKNGGGIMLYIREDIPAKLVSSANLPVESFNVEIDFRKQKWLINCSYNPKKSLLKQHLEALRKDIDIYSLK